MTNRYWPLKRGHVVTSGFGPRWGGMHFGVDFGWDGGSGGLPIYAVQGGTVVNVGPASGFGQWIVIDHPTEDGSGTTVYGTSSPRSATASASKRASGSGTSIRTPARTAASLRTYTSSGTGPCGHLPARIDSTTPTPRRGAVPGRGAPGAGTHCAA